MADGLSDCFISQSAASSSAAAAAAAGAAAGATVSVPTSEFVRCECCNSVQNEQNYMELGTSMLIINKCTKPQFIQVLTAKCSD